MPENSDPDPPAPGGDLTRAQLAAGLAAHLRRRIDLGERRTEAGALRTAPPRAVSSPPARPAEAPKAAPRPSTAPLGAELTSRAEANRELAAAAPTLEALRSCVAECTACALAKTRTQTVFADGEAGGTRPARVLFVGEAPGQHEDEQGIPFVGRAGELLTAIIEKGMGLDRREVVIANVLKCRPPGNRDPSPEEKALCTPFLDRQIELVDPEVVIPLGRHAAQHILHSTESMGRLRGRVHRPGPAAGALGGRVVIPTFHPAYLLRSPSHKKECWADIQLAMAELGLPRPG